jgi:hypothetical protein
MSKAVGNWTPHTQPKGDSKPQARCNFKSGREHAGPVTQFSRFVPAGYFLGNPGHRQHRIHNWPWETRSLTQWQCRFFPTIKSQVYVLSN